MVTASALRELHRIHRQLSDLRERLARGPKQIRARQVNVTKLEADLSQARAEAKAARLAADRKQLDLRSGEAKILDLGTKLNTCSTNKEYQALLDQIAAAKMASSVLSDEILEQLEKVDELDAKIAEADKLLGIGKQELAKFEKQVSESASGVEADLKRYEQELKQAEASLPPDIKSDYDRIVRAKGEDALAPVETSSCGGCYQSITANMLNDLYMSRAVFCRSCGRMLYLPEESETRKK